MLHFNCTTESGAYQDDAKQLHGVNKDDWWIMGFSDPLSMDIMDDVSQDWMWPHGSTRWN